jgi:hypothetical protein
MYCSKNLKITEKHKGKIKLVPNSTKYVSVHVYMEIYMFSFIDHDNVHTFCSHLIFYLTFYLEINIFK